MEQSTNSKHMRQMQTFTLAIILLSSCQKPSNIEGPDNFEKLFKGELRIIDLTHSLNDGSPFWPNEKNESPFIYTPIAQHPSGGVALGSYSTVEHFGTHLDAPIHFKDNMESVDQIDPADFFAPLVVIDVSNKCDQNADYRLTRNDILNWENRNGRLPNEAVVLMYTGWSKKWSDPVAYRNQDSDGKMHFPGFSVEANQFLVDQRNIKGIGIDNLSVDYGLSENFEAHLVTNGNGKYHLENIANLHLVPERGAYLIVAPIKLEGGSGGQVRIFAIVP